MRRRDVSERIHPFLYNRKFRWSRQRILWAEFYFHYQKGKRMLKLKKAAVAGTLESSDCQVTVEPGNGSVEFNLESAVINQYGNQIRKVVLQTLENLDVKDVKISVVDKGALDCTIKARVEGAVFRSVDQIEDIPWGGAIR
mgnify:CR=1 FL=1